jgi:hypothetical protein
MSEQHYQLLGWLLFVVCALLYALAALQSGDLLTLLGSVVFLVACFVFMIPLLRKRD